MTFDEKIKELRKNKHITQEELAKNLYVSRTTVSKWESGKGYPSLDILKQLAAFYQISIDDLLSNNELYDISKQTIDKNRRLTSNLILCLLDIFASILFFIPIFGALQDDKFVSVELFLANFSIIKTTLITCFLAVMVILGLSIIPAIFADKINVLKFYKIVSLIISGLLTFVFLITKEPYAGAIVLGFLAIKIIMILKK